VSYKGKETGGVERSERERERKREKREGDIE
jgi:hypothetical protein